jgi:predicted ArsR family transcriptional regulator
MFAANPSRQITAVAALAEPLRRALYEYVVAQPQEVSRDQAATGVGVDRAAAAFHLDRLVREGLLEASYRRLGSKTGPGAGRPSKLYRRGPAQVTVSLPQREYELAARLLLRAVADSTGPAAQASLQSAAREVGEALGRRARLASPRAHRQELHDGLVGQLRDHGFEPFADEEGVVRLRNCPFHSLACEQPELVCGMNLRLVEGMVDGLGEAGLKAVLDPRPQLCCVALQLELRWRGRHSSDGVSGRDAVAPAESGHATETRRVG